MNVLDNKKESGITIRPIGGLGNQLFIYATGRAAATRLECPLHVDLSYYTRSNPNDTPRSFAIDWLLQANEALRKSPDSKFNQLVSRFRTKFHLHNPKKIFQERDFAYDERINEIQGGTTLLGYFQSWKYFDSIEEGLRTEILEAAPKSPWFLDQQTMLSTLSPWIALHVRLGDYLSKSNSLHHGVISSEYYAKAIEEIENRLGTCNLVLFSDDPESAELLINQIHPVVKVMDPPGESHPMESIVLMSQANALITANSSFSWWGAWLANLDEGLTCVPAPWFATQENDDCDLCPPQWVRLPSSLNT